MYLSKIGVLQKSTQKQPFWYFGDGKTQIFELPAQFCIRNVLVEQSDIYVTFNFLVSHPPPGRPTGYHCDMPDPKNITIYHRVVPGSGIIVITRGSGSYVPGGRASLWYARGGDGTPKNWMSHYNIYMTIDDNLYINGWNLARLFFKQVQIIFGQKIPYDVIYIYLLDLLKKRGVPWAEPVNRSHIPWVDEYFSVSN